MADDISIRCVSSDVREFDCLDYAGVEFLLVFIFVYISYQRTGKLQLQESQIFRNSRGTLRYATMAVSFDRRVDRVVVVVDFPP
jgi:hypothetical protein